jgi:hypothetical protein
MRSYATPKFWSAFRRLPQEEKERAKKQYRTWQKDPWHPSLHFKKVGGRLWSARVSESYRALALEKAGEFHWFWIGHHREYEKALKGK